MTNLKNRMTHQVVAYDNRQSTLEVSQVDKVVWHKTANDKDYDLADLVPRERREKTHDPNFSYIRHRVPSIISGYHGRYQGKPINPRRGNAVKTVFFKNQKPLILGPVESKFEPPVCRPDPYTQREKLCQYRPLFQDEDKDFVTTFPDPVKPTCTNWQHGPCFGDQRDDQKEPCFGRDYYKVFDYCRQGNLMPSCEKCDSIDYPKRYGNTWLKVYSVNTMSCQAPNSRWELHQKCGSNLRFENATGRSVIYSEGKSHIQLKNAVYEDDERGQLNFQGESVNGVKAVGTIDLHTHTEDLPLADEKEGVRFAIVRPEDDQVTWAFELIDFPTSSFIRCYKDGKIEVSSCNGKATGTFDGLGEIITLKAKNIKLDGDVEVTGDLTVDYDEWVKGTCSGPNNIH
jgi:hypothetical protein